MRYVVVRRRGVDPRANSIFRGDKPPGYDVMRNHRERDHTGGRR